MKRVLIVEDQADIRKLIRMTLEFEPYEIHEAANGTDGLQLAVSVQPDLILLDVMMPGELDGLQVCAHVRALPALQGTRVVLLTARGQTQDRDAGQEAGADEYLIKPFSPLQLIETIERLMPAACRPGRLPGCRCHNHRLIHSEHHVGPQSPSVTVHARPDLG
jgi:two-component system, OmpR family, phosphate regulon response regulator PhoB